MLAGAGVGRIFGIAIDRPHEVHEMAQRNGMRRLKLAQALRVRRVRRFAVCDRERGLPRPRPDAERRLEPRVSPLAQHRGPREALFGDALPAQPRLIARAERVDPEETGDVRRQPYPGDLPAVAAELVHPQRGGDLLDAFAQRLDEIRKRVRIPGRDRVLEQEVRVHRVRADRERDHDVVKVPQASRGNDERALAPKRSRPARLHNERSVCGRENQQRIDPRASFREDRAVLDEDEARPTAHAAGRLGAEPCERVARMLLPVAVGLEHQRSASSIGCEAREDVFEQPCPALARQ